MDMKIKARTRGFALVEVVVASALISVFLFAASNASVTALRVVDESANKSRAVLLAEEALEAVRTLRDGSWSGEIANKTIGSTYYLMVNGGILRLNSANPGPVDGLFTRTVKFASVYRRTSDDDIVDVSSSDPKAIDPDTRQVTTVISWRSSSGVSRSVTFSTYITNIFKN